jgi:putative thioredoxin
MLAASRMNTPQYIHDISPETFNTIVLDNSKRGPVMVFYWSPNAGPCMRLLPRLIKLCDDFGGRFLLTLMNTDTYQDFAKQQGIISIPTVRIYHREKLAETVHGAYSEQMFRNTIEKYLPRAARRDRLEAAQAYQRGAMEQSVALMDHAAKTMPDDHRIRLDQAKVLVQQGNYAEALDVLEKLPNSAFNDPEIDLLATHLRFVRTAHQAPSVDTLKQAVESNPNDLRSRYQLSACLLVQDDYSGALEQLSKIVENESPLKEPAHRGMLSIFALLGPDHELCKRFARAHPPST